MSAGFALPRDAGRRPALLSRATVAGRSDAGRMSLGNSRSGRSVIGAVSRSRACRPEVGVPWPARRSARWGLGDCIFRPTHGGRGASRFRAPARADRRSAFPGLRAAPPGGVRRNCIFTARGGVALTGAGRSVIGAGFALPRDAGHPLAADPRPARGSHPRPVSSPAQVRSGSVMTSTRAGPLVASAVLKASVSCSARSTRMPRPPQRVA